MKVLKSLILIAGIAGFVGISRAQEFGGEDMNGYLGFGFALASHSSSYTTTGKSGSRTHYNLEFGRLSSNIALELSYGSGSGYSTIGGRFKIMRPIPIPENSSAYLLIPSLDFAANYSSSGIIRSTSDTAKTKFTDYSIGPNLRFMYDFKFGLALAADFRYDFVIQRQWGAGSPKKQTSPSDRVMYFGFSVMMDSRFIE